MKRSRFRKIAAEAYDRVLGNGNGEATIADFVAEIQHEVEAQGVTRDIIADFADGLARYEDDRRAKRADSDQLDLLTGGPEALDGVWRLGGGRRVRARNARREHVLLWLGIRTENAQRVADAYTKDASTVAEILVWMPDDGTTVEQAVRARLESQALEGTPS